ncbi:MAG: hypothetical protein MUE58_07735 [Chitinophagaceae bacterium]|nr:hypothetical protein [Chitinophagaceae bacterium]
MKKIPMVVFAIFFFSLSAYAGQSSCFLTVPFQAVVVGNPLSLSGVSPATGNDRNLHVQRFIQDRKFTTGRKMSFKDRLALRIMSKKIKKQAYRPGDDLTEADKMAKSSRTIGIIAVVLAAIPFITIIAAIPLGIIAINKASKAKKMGSTKKTGKVLGIVALAIVGLWIVIVTITLASGVVFMG